MRAADSSHAALPHSTHLLDIQPLVTWIGMSALAAVFACALFFTLYRILSRRERAHEALRRQREIAESASRAKSQFLTQLSHELRTPLTTIMGFAQILKEEYFGELQPKYKEYAGDIMASGQHLLDLVNDILDLAKIEAGRMELRLEKTSLAKLLESSIALIRENARRKGINTELHLDAQVANIEVEVDQRKLRQILLNLLSNAIKSTTEGGWIAVEAKQQGREVHIAVADSGIGLAPEEKHRLFEAFYQTGRTCDPSDLGTGLGLSLVKRLIELHGGAVDVDSDGPGKGSRFSFSIPLILS